MNKNKMIIYIILTFFTIVSLYIICTVGLGWFYKFGSFEDAERYNSVLLNLSYSYIAGYIFYILVTYLPSYCRKIKIRTVVNHKKEEIVLQIESNIQAFYSEKKQNILNDVDKENLISLIQSSDLYNQSFNGKEIGMQSSIMTLLRESRKVTLQLCEQILLYHDYMSETEILISENLREASYYRLLDCGPLDSIYIKYLVSSIQYKKELGEELFKVIGLVRNL